MLQNAMTGAFRGTGEDADPRSERRHSGDARWQAPVQVSYVDCSDLTPERRRLMARIQALECCVSKREPYARKEIVALLQGAVDVLTADAGRTTSDTRLAEAEPLFEQARRLYYANVNRENRRLYVRAALRNAALLNLAPPLVWALARGAAASIGAPANQLYNSVDLPALQVLVAFASLGSVVSVLSRMDKLTWPPVFDASLIRFAGGARPFVASAFALVAYALMRGGIVTVLTNAHEPILKGASGLSWSCFVIAFLCGYSERFASDLLGQVPPTPGLPEPTSTLVRSGSAEPGNAGVAELTVRNDRMAGVPPESA